MQRVLQLHDHGLGQFMAVSKALQETNAKELDVNRGTKSLNYIYENVNYVRMTSLIS
jgi:hypothetical protein